jgi:hypothetical protein
VTKTSPAVQEAKARRDKETGDGITTLSTGVRVRLSPVPPGILEDVAQRVRPPKVPMWRNPEKDVDEPNPNHPDYIEALSRFELEQAAAILDAMALFGMELADGLPADDRWLKQLKIMSKRGGFDINAYDLEDEVDREFLYKRYLALGNEDLLTIGRSAGNITGEDVERARRSFRDDEAQQTD